ncbi:hypothetical protein C8R44DRAFT_885745 [Mycena epipterygia]|nr:hypothetical protein C8R44DRAFT_885745 [Mycena epipterygia]
MSILIDEDTAFQSTYPAPQEYSNSSALTFSSSPQAPFNDQPNFEFFRATDLQSGNHTLVVNFTNVAGAQSLMLDYILYQQPFSPSTTRLRVPARPRVRGAAMTNGDRDQVAALQRRIDQLTEENARLSNLPPPAYDDAHGTVVEVEDEASTVYTASSPTTSYTPQTASSKR